jgi:hypothetical protein
MRTKMSNLRQTCARNIFQSTEVFYPFPAFPRYNFIRSVFAIGSHGDRESIHDISFSDLDPRQIHSYKRKFLSSGTPSFSVKLGHKWGQTQMIFTNLLLSTTATFIIWDEIPSGISSQTRWDVKRDWWHRIHSHWRFFSFKVNIQSTFHGNSQREVSTRKQLENLEFSTPTIIITTLWRLNSVAEAEHAQKYIL